MGTERTLGVLAACVAFLMAAVAAGLILFHTVQGPPGSTWNDYRVTSRGLAVAVSAKGCAEVTGADVAERKGRVHVTLLMERELPWYGYCASRMAAETFRVELDRPLGDRRVYDGACLVEEQRTRPCLREERGPGRHGTAVMTSSH